MSLPGFLAGQYGAARLIAAPRSSVEEAESLRDSKLQTMSRRGRLMACDPEGWGRTAAFWLHNAKKSGEEIDRFFVKRRELLERIARLEARLDRFQRTGEESEVLAVVLGLIPDIHDAPLEVGRLQAALMKLDDDFIP